jgi:hypothetical protein
MEVVVALERRHGGRRPIIPHMEVLHLYLAKLGAEDQEQRKLVAKRKAGLQVLVVCEERFIASPHKFEDIKTLIVPIHQVAAFRVDLNTLCHIFLQNIKTDELVWGYVVWIRIHEQNEWHLMCDVVKLLKRQADDALLFVVHIVAQLAKLVPLELRLVLRVRTRLHDHYFRPVFDQTLAAAERLLLRLHAFGDQFLHHGDPLSQKYVSLSLLAVYVNSSGENEHVKSVIAHNDFGTEVIQL